MNRPIASTRDVIIQVDSIDAATKFYAEVLGLPVVHRTERLVGIDTGAFKLYIEQGSLPGAVFEFLVPDLAAAKERLVAAGCRIETEDPTVPRCYLRDPFGLVFNIAER